MPENTLSVMKENLGKLTPDEAAQLFRKTFGDTIEANIKKWVPLKIVTLYYIASYAFIKEGDTKSKMVILTICVAWVILAPFFSQYKEERRFWPLGVICFLAWVHYNKPFIQLSPLYDTIILAGCVYGCPLIAFLLRPEKELLIADLVEEFVSKDKNKAMELLSEYKATHPNEKLDDLIVDDQIKVEQESNGDIKIKRDKDWEYYFLIQSVKVQTGSYYRLYRVRQHRLFELVLPEWLKGIF